MSINVLINVFFIHSYAIVKVIMFRDNYSPITVWGKIKLPAKFPQKLFYSMTCQRYLARVPFDPQQISLVS